MTVTHRTLAGGWALCADQGSCELLFHFPNVTPEEMAGAPLEVLLPLFEMIQPPVENEWGEKRWGYRERMPDGDMYLFEHRDYDLPANVLPGELRWMHHDMTHRAGDKPAVIDREGARHWMRFSQMHREGDKPAFVSAQGSMGWYQNGSYLRLPGSDYQPRPVYLQSPGEEFDPDETHWTPFFLKQGKLVPGEKVRELPAEWLPEGWVWP